MYYVCGSVKKKKTKPEMIVVARKLSFISFMTSKWATSKQKKNTH